MSYSDALGENSPGEHPIHGISMTDPRVRIDASENDSYDIDAFQALPLSVRIANYAAISGVFGFIFWMMFDRVFG